MRRNFRILLVVKVVLCVILTYFVHSYAHLYIQSLNILRSEKVSGALYGACAPVERLEDLNEETHSLLDTIAVSNNFTIGVHLFSSHHISHYFLFSAHPTSQPSKSIWRKSALSGRSSECATRRSAPSASATKTTCQISGSNRSIRTRRRCYRSLSATRLLSEGVRTSSSAISL